MSFFVDRDKKHGYNPGMQTTPIIFDHPLLRLRHQRALRQYQQGDDFLWQALVERLFDRLADVKRHFPHALEIGSHHGQLAAQLQSRYGIEQVEQIAYLSNPQGQEILPTTPQSIDLILSIAALQWANDLPGMLLQMRHALKPDGLCIAMIPGEETLHELRASLDAAMLKYQGGISPRISPMLGVKDAAHLMQLAGFTLPVIDRERIEICYSSPMKLMHDLRAMGQTNALVERSKRPLTKPVLSEMQAHYLRHFPHPEGGVRATFDIIALTGWAPHASQAKPLPRGSAKQSLKDALS